MTRATLVLIAATLIPCLTALGQENAAVAADAKDHERQPVVELRKLLDEVAARSGKKFLVEERVPAKIRYGGTDLENPDYPLLLSILRLNGLAAFESGGYVNIIPDAAIRQFPLPLVQRDDADIPAAEWVTRIITVRNGNAPMLVPVLRPLLPQAGHMASPPGAGNAPGDKLIVIGPYDQVRKITEIVREVTE